MIGEARGNHGSRVHFGPTKGQNRLVPVIARNDRAYWAHRIAALDQVDDAHQIYRILATYEFPWDFTQALSFALYRTYAVASIGRLLGHTGEFVHRTQKRYDDTGLILDTILEHGFASSSGRTALRRMNQMHGSYDISQDDLRYVLSTFVVVPIRWLDRWGWRPLTEHERSASANCYRELGRHMGITDIPAGHTEFAALLDDYERVHFGFEDGGRAVADATLDLMTTFPPNRYAPKAPVRRFARALMDEPLLDAFGYPHPTRAERAVASGALKARAALVRRMPPRRRPTYFRQSSTMRSYPDGYDVANLGTFPPRKPHSAPPEQSGRVGR